jgi:cytochrome oxidase Cu insertion factor (SCO1/SenC/PrrC family)
MNTFALRLWLVGTVLLLPGSALAQLQDHDPCGNSEPEETPVACGEYCKTVELTDGQGNVVGSATSCEQGDPQTPGFATCNVGMTSGGVVTCVNTQPIATCTG